MSNGDYVLGTRDDEVARLGLQHRVWRSRVLDAFRRARIRPDLTVVDVGAGPGFVTADLAEIVGPDGKVIALERAELFIGAIRARNLASVEVHQHDVCEPFPVAGADVSWCRWLLSFGRDPAATVRNIASALKPGGTAIFHEYADYGSWRMMPPDPLQDRFRSLVIQSWRDAGGEPDIALWLPRWLDDCGLKIVETRTYCDIIAPDDFAWEWPRAFLATNAARLSELGYISADEVEPIARLLDDCPANTRMVTPLVAEVIARKL
ncbi:MAG: methyltransferase domain-containing protein [Sphingomicrobium sp.]